MGRHGSKLVNSALSVRKKAGSAWSRLLNAIRAELQVNF
uniref:Uncharacterized protein n=1 Tax=Anguilla anguilla TaxID=7936 RepID=A0A0E9T9Y0_ANGAN